MTTSEQLFEDFCTQHDLSFSKIKEGLAPTPDYWIKIGDMRVLVEVKQIDPNKDERQILNLPIEELGVEEYIYHDGLPGDKIRKKITGSIPQLKALSQHRCPTLLIILNNVLHSDHIEMWPELTDSNSVKCAMYGMECALISDEVAPEGGAKILKKWHGPKKRLTTHDNTTLSALGIITKIEGQILLRIYHNYYAANPIPKELFQLQGVQQFFLDNAPDRLFEDWEQL